MSTRARLRFVLPLALALVAGACSSSGSSNHVAATAKSTTTTSEATTTTAAAATSDSTTSTTAAVTSTTVAAKGVAQRVIAPSGGTSATTAKPRDPITVHLGYFPNFTHGSAIVAIKKGFFQQALGNDKLSTALFNAGPAATEALLSGAVDATFIGPSPAVNAYVKSNGAVRIIAGSASGGALLVTGEDIASPSELKGTKLATPQLGNTQDVALRYWLKQQGIKTDPNGGGDLSIIPQDNAQTLDQFKQHQIQGAWLPEPWATRILQDPTTNAHVYIDERSLWPNGDFATTVLLVRKDFLDKHPDVVAELLEGQIRANDYIQSNPADAKLVVDKGIEQDTGKALGSTVVDAAWKNIRFTNDPIATSVKGSADHAVDVGLQKPVDNLAGIFDLRILNKELALVGEPQVKGL